VRNCLGEEDYIEPNAAMLAKGCNSISLANTALSLFPGMLAKDAFSAMFAFMKITYDVYVN
jgi:hypothetical protein